MTKTSSEKDYILEISKTYKEIEKLNTELQKLNAKLNRRNCEYYKIKEDNEYLREKIIILVKKASIYGIKLE